jgi:hypothetical protein
MFAWRRHILVMVLFLLICVRAGADHTLMVLPFEDQSGFDGQWDLSDDIPRLLAKRLTQIPGYWVAFDDATIEEPVMADSPGVAKCPEDSLQTFSDSLPAGFVIDGTVEEFGISRFGVLTPAVGGYLSYRAGVKVGFSLRQRGVDDPLLQDEAEGEIKQGELGLTLFGKPTDAMQEYEMLGRLEFGSQPFMATIIGQAIDTLLSDMVGKIQAALPPQRSPESAIGPAAIIFIDADQVYLNRGYDDGIKAGDRFDVYRQGKELHDPRSGELLGYSDRKVGAIRVILVKSAHLSVAEIVEGELQEGDEVR